MKPKKKLNEDSEVLRNDDGFWNDIPDEVKSSKHCRIFSKPRVIEDIPIKEQSRMIKHQHDRLEKMKLQQQGIVTKMKRTKASYDSKVKARNYTYNDTEGFNIFNA